MGSGERTAGLIVSVVIWLAVGGCAEKRDTSSVPQPSPAAVDTTSGPPEGSVPDTAVLVRGVEFVARGNEPFWAIAVTSQEIVFREPDRIDGIRGDPAVPYRRGAFLYFRTELRDSVPVALELAIEEKPCQDSMSGLPFPYTATAQVGDRRFEGCAERKVTRADTARVAP